MGHRVNLIIVRNQSYDLYYSHWCANTLPCDLFWGEQYAIRFIEMQTKMDESGRLQFQGVNQLRLLEQIKALLLGKASNPIAAIELFIKKEAGAGKRVKVNPHALTNNRYELSRDVREEILESAIKLLS